jgi:hypothetical protein
MNDVETNINCMLANKSSLTLRKIILMNNLSDEVDIRLSHFIKLANEPHLVIKFLRSIKGGSLTQNDSFFKSKFQLL